MRWAAERGPEASDVRMQLNYRIGHGFGTAHPAQRVEAIQQRLMEAINDNRRRSYVAQRPELESDPRRTVSGLEASRWNRQPPTSRAHGNSHTYPVDDEPFTADRQRRGAVDLSHLPQPHGMIPHLTLPHAHPSRAVTTELTAEEQAVSNVPGGPINQHARATYQGSLEQLRTQAAVQTIVHAATRTRNVFGPPTLPPAYITAIDGTWRAEVFDSLGATPQQNIFEPRTPAEHFALAVRHEDERFRARLQEIRDQIARHVRRLDEIEAEIGERQARYDRNTAMAEERLVHIQQDADEVREQLRQLQAADDDDDEEDDQPVLPDAGDDEAATSGQGCVEDGEVESGDQREESKRSWSFSTQVSSSRALD